ncbi:unnamed protein product [marine sediment metagenome]|uniref:Uncharacterized protein n=1 Tax=marine sediment metagenome TaxID=412755 RepID=X1N5M3_9ZZZZ
MSANKITIICLCGHDVVLCLDGYSKEFFGYCSGCDRGWKLKAVKPKERKP